jgi:hypothetical protein
MAHTSAARVSYPFGTRKKGAQFCVQGPEARLAPLGLRNQNCINEPDAARDETVFK